MSAIVCSSPVSTSTTCRSACRRREQRRVVAPGVSEVTVSIAGRPHSRSDVGLRRTEAPQITRDVIPHEERVDALASHPCEPVALLSAQVMHCCERCARILPRPMGRSSRERCVVWNGYGVLGPEDAVELNYDDSRPDDVDRVPQPVVDAVDDVLSRHERRDCVDAVAPRHLTRP
jgi:hypothetical protein